MTFITISRHIQYDLRLCHLIYYLLDALWTVHRWTPSYRKLHAVVPAPCCTNNSSWGTMWPHLCSSKLVAALMTRHHLFQQLQTHIFLYCAPLMVYKRWTTWELPTLKPGHLNRSRASPCCKSETTSSMLEDRTCATLKPEWRMKYRDKPVQNEWMDGWMVFSCCCMS